jgi:hypothetical protein
MTYLWTKISGPGVVTFTDATNPLTHVTFSVAGVYILRLTVTNGAGVSFDEISIVIEAGCAPGVADPVLPSCF